MDMREYGRVFLQPEELRKTGGQRREEVAEILPPEADATCSARPAERRRLDAGTWARKQRLARQTRPAHYRSDLINRKETTWIDLTPLNEEVHQ
jgi:transposase